MSPNPIFPDLGFLFMRDKYMYQSASSSGRTVTIALGARTVGGTEEKYRQKKGA